MAAVRLIVGLGNPGPGYANTRHNAGADWVRLLAAERGLQWRREARFFGELARLETAGHTVWLLIPETFMNCSGQAVAALLRFHRIPSNQTLVVHDELDLPPGVARLKQGGGHGGHNGLRDIMQALGGARDFARLRIGIGHPGAGGDVVSYVLRRPAPEEGVRIREASVRAVAIVPTLLDGSWDRAQQQLHTIEDKSSGQGDG